MDPSVINRDIYNTNYTADTLRLKLQTSYDRFMVRMRLQYIERFGSGRRVLDLCCGTGSYTIPVAPLTRWIVGLDFSRTMLSAFDETRKQTALSVDLIEGDAQQLPFANNCFDLVFSYTSLYSVPSICSVLKEISRVLGQDGYAVLELGNSRSLNMLVSNFTYLHSGWAKPYYVPYEALVEALKIAHFEPIEWRSFQLLPMYGAPPGMKHLRPLLTSAWKVPMAVQIRGRMLDEWICGLPWIRRLAFRHIAVVRKQA